MPRRRRRSTAGLVFHVLNRGAKRARIFDNDADYLAFERLLRAASERLSVAIFAYCLMPNHWHLVVSPRLDGGLSRFMHWLTTTHARRWHLTRDLEGEGAVYQGRFKAIPIGGDRHFLWVCRYVERNALRAGLVTRAEKWPWSSLTSATRATDWPRRDDRPPVPASWLARWPCPRPVDWTALVNRPQTMDEMIAFRNAVAQGIPFGEETWVTQILQRFGQPRAARRRGRPTKSVLIK